MRLLLDTVVRVSSAAAAVLLLPGRSEGAPVDDWQAAGWSQRAVVKVTAAGSARVDTAAVRVVHSGLARGNGADYRVYDEAGMAVPYQLTYHAAGRDTLMSFRCDRPGKTFHIYFGNSNVGPDPVRVVSGRGPGAGRPRPGAGGWIPGAGLVLTTMRRPREAENPKTVEELAALMRGSPGLDGGAYREKISDGFNPFGDSDYYISAYRGWIRLPRDGTYDFCTASNEASFSFLDGKPLVHWPGRHTEQRGKRGEKSARHKLKAGLHYLEYYHEEVLLYQVAFLGYRPPGASAYQVVPGKLFPRPHRAKVLRYEQRGGAETVMPLVELADSLWPTARAAGQYTRYRFSAVPGEGRKASGWTVGWDFGDGQKSRGVSAEHVYMTGGTYQIRMRAMGPAGQKVERRWPLVVYPIEHLAGGFKPGSYGAYVPLVSGYDRESLKPGDLAQLACFFDEAGETKAAAATAREVLQRSSAAPGDALEAHLILAGEAGTVANTWGSGSTTDEGTHLGAAVRLMKKPAAKMQALARLIRYAGIISGDLAAAEQSYKMAEGMVKEHGLDARMKREFRGATIAIGDAYLYARQNERAGRHYRRAEALAQPVIPRVVRAARLGEHPERVRWLTREGKLEEAASALWAWYEEFPSDLLRGEVFFWAGRLAGVRGDFSAALRPLRLAAELGMGSSFEGEARWLLAEAYGWSGDREGREATLVALIQSGIGGKWREMAEGALKEKR